MYISIKLMDNNLQASIHVKNKNNVWVDDNMVTVCYNYSKCRNSFGLFYRKHHCRNCGNVFCYGCASKYIDIPEFITDRPTAADYWNPSYHLKYLRKTEERVCDRCYDSILSKKNAYQKITSFVNNPPSIHELLNPKSDIDSNIKEHYLDHMRNVQYYLPNHLYTQIDKKILKSNAKNFSQHSKYIVHLIKSIDWSSSSDSKMIMDIINSPKNTPCEDLFCTRTCQEVLTFDDCVNILYSCVNALPNEIITYLFEIITQTPEHIILYHMSFFTNLIKHSTNDTIKLHIFNLICESKKLVYMAYWLLMCDRANPSDIISNMDARNANSKIDSFFGLFDEELLTQISNQHCFYTGLIASLDTPTEYLIRNFDSYAPIPLPYDPDVFLTEVYVDSIDVKNSYTKPVIITFNSTVGKKRLLFKRESVLNDMTVLNLIELGNVILQEHTEKNFGAIVYPVMPITAESGMIEIVENAETVYNICSEGKEIWQYILEKNKDKLIGDVLKTYRQSLVSYTLHSYFIGLGDRHLQNIMITDDGKIFHIDFGFILGKDAYPITSTDIKLNADMLSVLGGEGSPNYEKYIKYCSYGVVILRKYFNMFFILLNQIKCNSIKEKHIENFILTRFQPRQDDNSVINELMCVIHHSNGAYGDYIRDFLHYHSQEKTIQKGINGIVKTAIGIIRGKQPAIPDISDSSYL